MKLWWKEVPMQTRRAILREADLWDGNTYAACAWDELPAHIRTDIFNATIRILATNNALDI